MIYTDLQESLHRNVAVSEILNTFVVSKAFFKLMRS